MKFFRKIFRLTFHSWGRVKFHLFESDNLIINWSNFDKGILLCFFGAFCQVSAIKWYLFSCYSEENLVWINHDFFFVRISTVVATLIVFIGMIVLSYRYKHNAKFRQFIAYFSPVFFGAVMIYAGYTVGMFSPATIAGFVNIVLIGLVYYSRKMIYGIALFCFYFYYCYQLFNF